MMSRQPHYGGLTKPSRSLDRDRLSMVHRESVIHATHRALDAIQNESPEVMMAAADLLFATLVKRTYLDPQTEHHRGLRLLRDATGHTKDNRSLQSLQDFAGIRINGETTVSIS